MIITIDPIVLGLLMAVIVLALAGLALAYWLALRRAAWLTGELEAETKRVAELRSRLHAELAATRRFSLPKTIMRPARAPGRHELETRQITGMERTRALRRVTGQPTLATIITGSN